MENWIGVFAIMVIIVFALVMTFGRTAEARHAARWSRSIHQVWYPRERKRPAYWIAWIVTAAGAAYYLWLLRNWLLN